MRKTARPHERKRGARRRRNIAGRFCAASRAFVNHPLVARLPRRERHRFTFAYDPAANKGFGKITITVDDQPYHLNIDPQQRRSSATFDRFGILSLRRGGKYVTVYFDDLTYTARRPKEFRPVPHPQRTVTVPYPDGGRKY